MCVCLAAAGVAPPPPLQDSFDHVKDWLAEVNRYAADSTCKLLIGNKCDRSDVRVPPEDGEVRGQS